MTRRTICGGFARYLEPPLGERVVRQDVTTGLGRSRAK